MPMSFHSPSRSHNPCPYAAVITLLAPTQEGRVTAQEGRVTASASVLPRTPVKHMSTPASAPRSRALLSTRIPVPGAWSPLSTRTPVPAVLLSFIQWLETRK